MLLVWNSLSVYDFPITLLLFYMAQISKIAVLWLATANLIADKGACVQDCGIGRVAGKEGKCVDCDGPCPKSE